MAGILDGYQFSPQGFGGQGGGLLDIFRMMQSVPMQQPQGFPDALPPNAQPTAGVAPQVMQQAPQTMQMPQQSFLGGLSDGIANNSAMLMALGGGMMSGGIGKGLSAGALAQLSGTKNSDDIKEYEYARRQGFKGGLADWMAQKRGGAGERGLTPIYGTDAQGNTVLIQPTKTGPAHQMELPPGVKVSTGVEKLDLGDRFAIQDKRTGQIIGYEMKNLAAAEQKKVEGKGQGEAAEALRSMQSKMPGLEGVVKTLDDLSEKATYTMTGRVIDEATRQAGLEPRASAVARAQYISMVDNQILPLLRDTFGSQFTEREGATLRQTLGDPNKAPKEKQAVLKAFIEQKRRDIEALQSRVGGASAAPAIAAPAAPNVPPPPPGFVVR